QALLAARRAHQAAYRRQRALHRALRAARRPARARAGLRRCHLRAHSSRQPAPHRGHALRQHRRLGGMLFRAPREGARRAAAAALAARGARPVEPRRSPGGRRRVRIALASDAWTPQTNGVVTTLRCTAETLTALGHEVRVISPQGLSSIACPSYPEIRLAVSPGAHVARQLKAFCPHAIHIATEGPLGLAVRRYCRGRGLPFTSSYHTRYPQYLRARWPIPLAATYAWLRRFHGAATRTFVSSPSLEAELCARGFARLHRWRRGVDLHRFRPLPPHPQLAHLPRPIMACVGRLAVEKNLDAFLRLGLPGTKVMIGDGPERHALAGRYPGAVFTGYRFGEELARCLATADVLVFPSLTDTFGLAMIEALACG